MDKFRFSAEEARGISKVESYTIDDILDIVLAACKENKTKVNFSKAKHLSFEVRTALERNGYDIKPVQELEVPIETTNVVKRLSDHKVDLWSISWSNAN
jgi:predicted CoA-binding protein